MSEPWRGARELLVVQVSLVALGLGGSMLTPIRLGLALPTVVLAVLLGAWAWAMRVGRAREQLGREAVRALSWRAGVGLGLLASVVYAVMADLPWAGLMVVSATLGLGAMAAGTMLTLCGLDLGRERG